MHTALLINIFNHLVSIGIDFESGIESTCSSFIISLLIFAPIDRSTTWHNFCSLLFKFLYHWISKTNFFERNVSVCGPSVWLFHMFSSCELRLPFGSLHIWIKFCFCLSIECVSIVISIRFRSPGITTPFFITIVSVSSTTIGLLNANCRIAVFSFLDTITFE